MKKHRILSILLAAFLALPTPVFAAESDDSGLSAYSEDESTESGSSGSAATSTLTATVDSLSGMEAQLSYIRRYNPFVRQAVALG